jgi:hypothetical protein
LFFLVSDRSIKYHLPAYLRIFNNDFRISPCLFFYLKQIGRDKKIAALQNNFLASETNVFIFSDGPKDNVAKGAVTEVRSYI